MINRFIFSQVNLDSGSLTVLASIVHRFSEQGLYYCKIKRSEKEVGSFQILVGDEPTFPTSVKIDLKLMSTEFPEPLGNEACNCLNISVGGYAVFFVSSGIGGYTLDITMPEVKGKTVFDSRKLSDEDMFVATLLRPGAYKITNVLNKAQAELRVTYPEIGKTKRNVEPVKLHCGEKEISPANASVNPGQGAVFSFKVPSRIKIELAIPEDRPKPVSVQIQASPSKARLEVKGAKKAVRQIKVNLSKRS
jgi:hypothetical protein